MARRAAQRESLVLMRGSPALSDGSDSTLLAVALSTAIPTHSLGTAAAAVLVRCRALVNAAAGPAR